MKIEPGSALHRLLMGATLFAWSKGRKFHLGEVLDIHDDVVIVLTDEQEVRCYSTSDIVKNGMEIAPTDEAWAEWRIEKGLGIKFSDLWPGKTP